MNGRNNSEAAGVSESVRGFYARGVPEHHRVMPLTLFDVDVFPARACGQSRCRMSCHSVVRWRRAAGGRSGNTLWKTAFFWRREEPHELIW